jgi:hypothetical protein
VACFNNPIKSFLLVFGGQYSSHTISHSDWDDGKKNILDACNLHTRSNLVQL